MSDALATLRRLFGPDAATIAEAPASLPGIPTAHPASEDELVELLHLASRERWNVLPIGCGSKLGWCPPAAHADLALSTRRLSGVVAYEGADGTLTARAGTTMQELHEVTSAGGNHLTPLVPGPHDATLGGVLAAGQSGIDRARHGPSRNHVLGMRVALADGSIVKSGGRLVKNVTGYDMHRLYCGSHGTLCVILEASLRLFPAPVSEVAITQRFGDRARALQAARTVAALPVRVLALVVESVTDPGMAWTLHVLLGGRRETVEWESAAIQRELHEATVDRADAARAGLERVRDLELAQGRWPHLHLTSRPSDLLALIDLVEQAAAARRLLAGSIVQPSIATLDVRFLTVAGAPVDPPASDFQDLVRELRASGLDVRVRRAPADVMRSIDPWGEPPAGIEIMRRAKNALDPHGLFAAGRFHDGL